MTKGANPPASAIRKVHERPARRALLLLALALLAALAAARPAHAADWPPKGAAETRADLYAFYDYTIENRGWENIADGALVHVRVYQPWGEGPFPAAVLAPPPGRAPIVPLEDVWNKDVSRDMDTAAALAERGVAVVLYNPPGRGIAPFISTGKDDQYGYMSQDALAAVVRATARVPFIDPANIGIASEGEGLAAAAGALARHPDLAVRWLLDAEGPWDNLEIMGYTWDQITPYSADRHMQKASLYWQHWPSARDESPENLNWWSKREPRTYFHQIHVRFYQRVQYQFDRVQPPGYHAHALHCFEAALASPLILYARVNRLSWNEPLPAHRQPAPLPGAMSDIILPLAAWILDMAALPDIPSNSYTKPTPAEIQK
jgi:hypothetical protein